MRRPPLWLVAWLSGVAAGVLFVLGFVVEPVTYLARLVDVVQQEKDPGPIVIHNQRLRWLDRRKIEIRSDGADWTKTCPRVHVSRFLRLVDGSIVAVETRVISGPLAAGPTGQSGRPRYFIATKPDKRAPSVQEIDLPEWIAEPEEVVGYMVVTRVYKNQPCEDGYSGVRTPIEVAIPPPPPRSRS